MITIKKAVSDTDYRAIAEIAEIIWHEHFTPIIGMAQVEYMLDLFQSYEAIKDMIENKGYVYFMAYDNGELCGYIGAHKDGSEVLLSKIYVEKHHRGKKISKEMINTVKNEFPDYTKLWLTVNKNNTNSIAAYKKMGFYVSDTQCADIGGGFVMDDFIMEYIP